MRNVFGRLLAGGAALGGLLVTILILGLVNGGLIYRKQCPTAQATVRTDWSYRWFAPVPYLLAPKEGGCEVHSGTRVALSSLGIASLKTRSAADLERNFAESGRTDPGVAYISGVIAVITDLRTATRQHVGFQTALKVMQKGAHDLHALRPPDYLASDHPKLLAVYDRSVAEAQAMLTAIRTGDQVTARKHSKRLVAATGAFLRIADRMQQVVLSKQG
ncbi:MAG: hypothetical protein M3R70_04150 [Actinomycetota bacterium]|nr:hypothetical protein [Actinomycetota bacterium]